MIEQLKVSNEHDEVERDLKRLFAAQYAAIETKLRDVLVTGNEFLGSADLARRAVANDGLALLASATDEHTRQILRQWRSQRGVQKRGWSLLENMLARTFPGEYQIEQLWLDSSAPYPTPVSVTSDISWWLYQLNDGSLAVDGTWKLGHTEQNPPEGAKERLMLNEHSYLSSRLRVTIGQGGGASVATLRSVMRAILPARLCPEFVLWAGTTVNVDTRVLRVLHGDLPRWVGYPWRDLVVTDNPVRQFRVSATSPVMLTGASISSEITP